MKAFLTGLLFFAACTCFAQVVPSSKNILSAAYKQAVKENKNVFVIFHASWCGWCKKMDASMNDLSTKKYFNDNFIIVHLTVLESPENKNRENPGAAEFLKKLSGENAGLPFFVILNKEEKVLANSFVKEKNIGCPASESEVAAFIILLKNTSTINKEGLEIIAARFKQNKPQ